MKLLNILKEIKVIPNTILELGKYYTIIDMSPGGDEGVEEDDLYTVVDGKKRHVWQNMVYKGRHNWDGDLDSKGEMHWFSDGMMDDAYILSDSRMKEYLRNGWIKKQLKKL